MHLRAFVLPLFIIACNGADAPKSTPAPAKSARARPEPKDRSSTPLKSTSDTIAGVAFTIDIPEGLKRETNDKDQWVNWTFTDGDAFTDPSITVRLLEPAMAPRDLASMVRRMSVGTDKPPLTVAKQEERPDGMLVAVERADGQYLRLESIVRKDDKILQCSVTHRTGTGKPDDRPIASFPAMKTWAEKLCGSLKFS